MSKFFCLIGRKRQIFQNLQFLFFKYKIKTRQEHVRGKPRPGTWPLAEPCIPLSVVFQMGVKLGLLRINKD